MCFLLNSDEDSDSHKFKSNNASGLWTKVGEDIIPQPESLYYASCGFDVDISEDGQTVLVGCPGAAGSVHLYRLSDDDDDDDGDVDGTSTKTWNEIINWVGQSQDDGLGLSVSMDESGGKVAFASNGSYYAGKVEVFENNDGDEFVPVGESIDDLGGRNSLSGDGQQICVADNSGYSVDVYGFDEDETSWKPNVQIDTSNIGPPAAVTLSEDGNKIGFVAYGGTRLFGADDLDKPLYSDDESTSIAVSNDGSVIAVANFGFSTDDVSFCGRVQLFDVTTDDAVQIGGDIFGPNEWSKCGDSLDLSRDGKRVAIGCYNKALIATLNESNPDDPVWDIDEIAVDGFGWIDAALSSDGETVALGGYGANIYSGAVVVYKRTTQSVPNQITKLE